MLELVFLGTRMLNHYIIIVIILVWFTSAQADRIHDKAAELKKIKHQIHQTQQRLRNAKGKRDALEEELKHNELSISQYQNQLQHIQTKKRVSHSHLKELNHQLLNEQQKLKQQQHVLAQQLRLAYKMGDYQPLKLILKQQHPATWQQLLQYQKKIHQKRMESIHDLKHSVENIFQYQIQIAQKQKHLLALEHQQINSLKKIKRAKLHNRHVLGKLNHGISSHQQQLERLKQSRHELAVLIKHLQQLPAQITDSTPFKQMKHRLAWPIQSTPAKQSQDKQGIFISAQDGVAIHAIYPGRVIFADWLRAYGLLIIIQHNSGYMSLYAHNDALYKKIGDKVQAGDVIAKVGHSGGNRETGLYFEIRHHGKPVDPHLWCR